MYYVKFNKDTSELWIDSYDENYILLKSIERFCTNKLMHDQSLTLRDILRYLCIKEDAPHELYSKTSAHPEVDFGLQNNTSKSPDFILCIEVYT